MGNNPVDMTSGAQFARFRKKQTYSSLKQVYSSLELACTSLEIPREDPVIKYPDQVYTYKKSEKKTGILNPIVLAQLMSRIPLENPELLNDQQVISYLNQYIEGIPEERKPQPIKNVKDLYRDNSVLFQPVVTGAILSSAKRAKIKNINSAFAMASVGPHLVVSEPQEAGESIEHTGAGSSPGSPADKEIKLMGKATYWEGSKKGQELPQKWGAGNRRQIIGDIMQGASVDCYFMAAVFSLAWKLKCPIIPAFQDGVYKHRFWTFNSVSNSWEPADYPLETTLPLNSESRQIFAQPTPEFSEVWPALYEKAYAEYKTRPPLDPNVVSNASQRSTPPYDPDIGSLPQWDAVLALSELTGIPARTGSGDLGYPTVYMTDDIKAPDTVFTILDGCSNIVNTFPKNPTVAWTKDAAAFPADLGVDMVLAPSHSYSVLGTHTTASGKWLVLRNPWGWPVNQATAHPDFRNEIAPAIPGSPEKPNQWKYDEYQPYYLPINANTYGIFGITDTGFKKYFKGFGWVQAS